MNQFAKSLHTQTICFFTHHKTDGIHKIWLAYNIYVHQTKNKKANIIVSARFVSWSLFPHMHSNIQLGFLTRSIWSNNRSKSLQWPNGHEAFIGFEVFHFNILEKCTHFVGFILWRFVFMLFSMFHQKHGKIVQICCDSGIVKNKY